MLGVREHKPKPTQAQVIKARTPKFKLRQAGQDVLASPSDKSGRLIVVAKGSNPTKNPLRPYFFKKTLSMTLPTTWRPNRVISHVVCSGECRRQLKIEPKLSYLILLSQKRLILLQITWLWLKTWWWAQVSMRIAGIQQRISRKKITPAVLNLKELKIVWIVNQHQEADRNRRQNQGIDIGVR